MIRTQSLVYKLDLRLNKLASNEHQEIPIENKILILREAIIALIKKKMNQNNPLHLGFDANKKRYHDLQVLIEKAEDHEVCLDLIDEKTNKWGCDITALRPRAMFLVGGYMVADKGECKGRIINIDVELAKHGDINLLLRNSDYAPSFEYQETLSSLSGNTFEVYTDGTFTPKDAYISYLRYPEEIDYEGYCDFDGTPSSIVDSELPDYLEDEILDIATESLALYTENIPAVQGSQAKIQTNE
jgi:hypothetical protein